MDCLNFIYQNFKFLNLEYSVSQIRNWILGISSLSGETKGNLVYCKSLEYFNIVPHLYLVEEGHKNDWNGDFRGSTWSLLNWAGFTDTISDLQFTGVEATGETLI